MKVVKAEFIKSATDPSHYPEGLLPEIAFAGRSNVGKSSLINTLTSKKNLARTSSTPGCTQLINFFIINDKISFVDLPGYGFAKVPASVRKNWKPMIEKYLMGRKNLRLVILILDIRRNPSEDEFSFVQWLCRYNIPFLFVLTKSDKLSRNQQLVRRRAIREFLGLASNPVLFSARTGEGKSDIWKHMRDKLDHEHSPLLDPESMP